MRRTNMHLDSCSLTTAHALLPGDYCISSSLSRRMPVRWHAAELTVKLRSTDRLLSLLCARTVCWVIYCFNHTGHPTHLPNASFLYAVSPHISERNCTTWQWCFLIFSSRVYCQQLAEILPTTKKNSANNIWAWARPKAGVCRGGES